MQVAVTAHNCSWFALSEKSKASLFDLDIQVNWWKHLIYCTKFGSQTRVLCADVRLSKQPQQVRVKFKIDFLYSYVSHLILVKMSWGT